MTPWLTETVTRADLLTACVVAALLGAWGCLVGIGVWAGVVMGRGRGMTRRTDA